ncbi:hypothetical protein [Geodermatophilus sp. URMC 64]
MNRSRLLLVFPATTALVFTGLSPAWAHGDYDHHGPSAEVLSIDDDVRANDDGDKAWVSFDYRCRGEEKDIDVEVDLRQGDAHLEADFNGKGVLDCDGDRHTLTVTVRDRGDDLRNDDADVRVRFEEADDGDLLDELTDDVDVSGVDRHDDKRRDDNRHHDDHDYRSSY